MRIRRTLRPYWVLANVTAKGEQNSSTPPPGFSFTGLNSNSGTWSITDPSITHLTLKIGSYFAVFEVSGTSGSWGSDPSSWLPDITSVACLISICGSPQRNYALLDFLSKQGNVQELSHTRAFSVVPLPAAAWLFISSLLGLFGVRKIRGT